MSRSVWYFGLAILLAGILRLTLTLAGVADEITKYSSMTAVILAGAVYFGIKSQSYRKLLFLAYALILPYMLMEVIGLGYTWYSGRRTIFHIPQYVPNNKPIHSHFWGHVVGGLTWEPLMVFLLMAAVHWLYGGWTSLMRSVRSRTNTF